MCAQDLLLTGEMSKQGNGHDGLAQPHFICQDAIQAAHVDGHQPVQTNVLVLSQAMLQQKRHLHCHELVAFASQVELFIRQGAQPLSISFKHLHNVETCLKRKTDVSGLKEPHDCVEQLIHMIVLTPSETEHSS